MPANAMSSMVSGYAQAPGQNTDQLARRLMQAIAAQHPDDPHQLASAALDITAAGSLTHQRQTGAVALRQALNLTYRRVPGPGNGPVRRSLAIDLISGSLDTGHGGDLLAGLLWLTVDLFLAADSHAERRLSEVRRLMAKDNHETIRHVVAALEVMLAIRAGDLAQAERQSVSSHSQSASADATMLLPGWHMAQLSAIRWYQGRIAELLPALASTHASDFRHSDSTFAAILALAAASAGELAVARHALTVLCGHDLTGVARSSSWLANMNAIVEAAHILGDAEISAQAYRLLLPFANLPMMSGPGAVCFGSTYHALGVASLTTGSLDQAVEHFDAAIHQNLALAHWPAVAVSRQRYAQALTQRAHPLDAAIAERELAAATSEASALGIGIIGAETPSTPRPTVSLTRDGIRWHVTLGSRTVSVEHSIGMFHLAVLTANPFQEIGSLDLVAGLTALSTASAAGASDFQALTSTATTDYHARLTHLRHEIHEMEMRDDAGGTSRKKAERDRLLAELAGSAGIGGRGRRSPGTAEQARIAVGKAIRRTIRHISKADMAIGEHLRRATHTGKQCSYRPY